MKLPMPTTGRSSQLPFVIFRVKDGLYGVSSEDVREIVILPVVVGLPNQAAEIRGVINLRGKVLTLVDLRVKLGLPAAKVELGELIQLLHDRERDHHNWLAELEASVRERRTFSLARDPHACKFGLWYDRFQTDNNLLKMTLKKMDEPHQIIHATAGEVLRLAEGGSMEQANQLLAARRNGELAVLTRLFEDARRTLREGQRELAMVLNCRDKRFAISIDQVEAVERIPEEGIEPMPPAMAGQSGQQHWRIGKRIKTSQTILLLDAAGLFAAGTQN
jgi:purine-binding chemotaxis protein CheW